MIKYILHQALFDCLIESSINFAKIINIKTYDFKCFVKLDSKNLQ